MKRLFILLLLPYALFIFLSFGNDDVDAYQGWQGIIFNVESGPLGRAYVSETTRDFDERRLLIPTTFEGRPIRFIRDGAFSNGSLISVDFSRARHLQEIGDSAFSNNLITEVFFGRLSLLTRIGDNAFSNNNINQVNLECLVSLEIIGTGAFADNEIRSLNLRNLNNLSIIESGTFENNLIFNLRLENLSNLRLIRQHAFASNPIRNLEVINLPSIEVIHSDIFVRRNFVGNIEFYPTLELIYLNNLQRLHTFDLSWFTGNQVFLELIDLFSLERFIQENISNSPIFQRVIIAGSTIKGIDENREWWNARHIIFFPHSEVTYDSDVFVIT